eukprot:TRINITY_DN2321_c0_g1_i4.p1 TRINITY_DN2321_c0_g1~~TRINITY_DN2321_c0_g1_i4.p1  ORF type:complete len:146 (+),score=46.16 TRINITY_DN2321_c0_g1_i4:87-524(+)
MAQKPETKPNPPKTGGGEPKNWSPQVDSAAHVLKGAAQKVLNTPLTLRVEYVSKSKGSLFLEFEGEKPDDGKVKQIEELANKKLQENAPFKSALLPRQEAETKFGTIIYDKVLPPSEVTEVTLLILDDWNINCCKRQHLTSTALK